MKKFIVIALLMSCGVFETLLSSYSWDQAVQYQHKDAGFDVQDFDHDDENREEFLASDTDLDSQLQEKYSSWQDVLSDSILLHQEDNSSNKELEKSSDNVAGIESDSSSSFSKEAVVDVDHDKDTRSALKKIETPLKWSQLESDEDRTAYVKRQVVSISKSNFYINFLLVATLLNNLSDDQVDYFFTRLYHYISSKEHKFVLMKDVAHAYEDVKDSQGLLSRLISYGKFKFLPNSDDLDIAYHESGHALVSALLKSDVVSDYTTTISDAQRNSGGHMHQLLSNNWSPFAMNSTQSQNDKNRIAGILAGPVAEAISSGCIISDWDLNYFKTKFLMTKTITPGGGSVEIIGSDMNQAYELAKKYCRDQRILASDQDSPEPTEEEIDEVLMESFELAYNTLSTHRQKLDDASYELYKNKIFSDNIIYEIAQTPRPEYIFEGSWLDTLKNMGTDLVDYTLKRMSFYEKNNPPA